MSNQKYVMVPVEPTEKMLDVLYANMGGSKADGALISGYKNLLAAAPQAHAAPDVVGLLNRIIPRIDAGGPNPIDPDIHCCEWTLHRERERIHAEFADALTDHERLQAEAERLQASRAADKARIAELEAALSDVERDAARYLWLLKHYGEFHGDRTLAALALRHGNLDAAIDAALSKQGKERIQ